MDPKVPESRRLAALLRHEILEGRYSVSDPFPSLRELAERYGVGLRTVRTATDELVRERLLYRRERSGTFVRRPAAPAMGGAGGGPLRCINIIERPTGTFPSFVRIDYLRGYTQALEDHPIKLRVSAFPRDVTDLPSVFAEGFAPEEQGCVLVNIVDAAVIRWLTERKVPFVVQNFTQYAKEGLPPHHSVAVNKVGGGFRATDYLIGLGHRRIGYAGFVPNAAGENLTEVYDGFQAAMRCAGLEVRSGDIMPVSTDEPPMAYEPALRWMRGHDLPTAILTRTDASALGILRAAQTLGVRVPQDLSVVGYNDQHEAAESQPPLTTVGVPRVQLGRTAVEILLQTAANPAAAPVARVLDCELIERQSAAAPRGGESK